MGKRELLIISAFAIVAFVVYQFTAPPPKGDEQGFSLSRMDLDLRGCCERVLIGIAGVQIIVQHARPRLLQHALRALMHP